MPVASPAGCASSCGLERPSTARRQALAPLPPEWGLSVAAPPATPGDACCHPQPKASARRLPAEPRHEGQATTTQHRPWLAVAPPPLITGPSVAFHCGAPRRIWERSRLHRRCSRPTAATRRRSRGSPWPGRLPATGKGWRSHRRGGFTGEDRLSILSC